MAIVADALDAPTRMAFYLELVANANGIPAIVEAVQGYLANWPQERIASLQKIDGGWAPFDEMQRPLHVYSPAALQCYRDAIQRHCTALREANIELTPELVELDEFFSTASKWAERYGEAALQRRTAAIGTPIIPSHADMFVNW